MATTSPWRLRSRGSAGGTRRLPFGLVVTVAGESFTATGTGAFLYVRTYATPGIFSATVVSMLLMRARGCGHVRNRAWSMSGKRTRLAYSAFPVNRGIETSARGG